MTAAFFDVDGTITRTTIVLYYFLYRRQTLSGFRRTLWVVGFSLKCLGFLAADLVSRPAFNHWFYKSYRGIDAEAFRTWADETFDTITKPRIYPEAEEAIREHRAKGERIVFVTGGIEETVAPLARYLEVEDVIANHLEVKEGRFTGRLVGDAIAGEAKVGAMEAAVEGLDLSKSFAYSDSITDKAMLSAVGHAIAVNPGLPLKLKARRAGWPIERWGQNGAS